MNVRQFILYVSSKKLNIFFSSYAFPIMYATILVFFWGTHFSSISTKNYFFLLTFSTIFFLTFVATNFVFLFFLPPPPPQISNGASLRCQQGPGMTVCSGNGYQMMPVFFSNLITFIYLFVHRSRSKSNSLASRLSQKALSQRSLLARMLR